MNLDINSNKVLLAVLLYPAILFFPNIFREKGFWLTAPYFFIIFLFFIGFIGFTRSTKIARDSIFVLLFGLLLVAIFNFSTLRYSLPLFFVFYAVILFVFMSTIKDKLVYGKIAEYGLYFYFLLSIPFLLSPIGYVHQGRFAGFVGSPTIYAGFITILFVISSLRLKRLSIKYIALFLTTLFLVYITKTRLLLMFLIVYPVLRELIFSRGWLTKRKLFLIFYGTTLFIYPLYVSITEWFPNLLTLRYSGKTDTSFALRNYLFVNSKHEFLDGSMFEIVFGKGNEYARNFIFQLTNTDYMPHNDYLRILIDWGIVGFALFSFLLYRLAVKNVYTLFIALTYMVLFYSNMVFNLFLISLLIIFYFKDNLKKNKILDS